MDGGTKLEGAVPVQTALDYREWWLARRTAGASCREEKTERAKAYFAGQQAGLLLASRRHTWPLAQQMLAKAAPWLAHE